MFDIPVYSTEINDGIAELVKSTAAVAYCVKTEPLKDSLENIQRLTACIKDQHLIEKAMASAADSDLYFTKSLLVSANWNENDDVFDPTEVWLARHTPAHKPDNLGHDELKIIGHMLESWPIDDDGVVIADNTPLDLLPDTFHLLNNSVIYRTWQDKAQQKLVAELIEQIEKDEKFVSMECLFHGFDYAAIASDGSKSLIRRNADTSFLTKHLRAYKGTGEYEGYKLGRVLRRITFSAKGYVDRPANKNQLSNKTDKIIKFAKAAEITSLQKKGVYNNSENVQIKTEHIMAEITTDTTAVAELKSQLKALQDEYKTLASKHIAEANEKHESQIAALKAEAAALVTANEAAKAEQAKAANTVVELSKKNDELTKAHDTTKAELVAIKTEVTKAQRINTLIAGKVEAESAKATVEKFSFLNDEQFAAVAELAVSAAKKDDKACMTDAEKAAKDKEDKAKAEKAAANDAEDAAKKAFKAKQAAAKAKKDKEKADMDEDEDSEAAEALENAEADEDVVITAGVTDTEVEGMSEVRKSIAAFMTGKYVNRNATEPTETE